MDMLPLHITVSEGILHEVILRYWLQKQQVQFYRIGRAASEVSNFYVIGQENCRIRRNNAKYWPLRRSRSLKVTDFGTNRKSIGLCDFQLVINSNLNIRINFTYPETRRIVLPDTENRTIVSLIVTYLLSCTVSKLRFIVKFSIATL